MSTLSLTLAANKARAASILAWRAAPTRNTLVTIKGVEGVYRFTGRISTLGAMDCVKQKDGKDWQASKFFAADRVTPA